jgi:hypothetical protein
MHFTVPEQVNDSDLSHGQASLPGWPIRARCGLP